MSEPNVCFACGRLHPPGPCPETTIYDASGNTELTIEQLKAGKEIVELLRASKFDLADEKRQSAGLPPEFFQTEMIVDILKEALVYNFSEGFEHVYKDILEKFPLSETDLEEALQKGLIEALNFGSVKNAVKLKNEYNIADDFINSSEVQSAAKKCKDYLLTDEHLGEDSWQIELLKKEFHID